MAAPEAYWGRVGRRNKIVISGRELALNVGVGKGHSSSVESRPRGVTACPEVHTRVPATTKKRNNASSFNGINQMFSEVWVFVVKYRVSAQHGLDGRNAGFPAARDSSFATADGASASTVVRRRVCGGGRRRDELSMRSPSLSITVLQAIALPMGQNRVLRELGLLALALALQEWIWAAQCMRPSRLRPSMTRGERE